MFFGLGFLQRTRLWEGTQRKKEWEIRFKQDSSISLSLSLSLSRGAARVGVCVNFVDVFHRMEEMTIWPLGLSVFRFYLFWHWICSRFFRKCFFIFELRMLLFFFFLFMNKNTISRKETHEIIILCCIFEKRKIISLLKVYSIIIKSWWLN